MVRWTPVQVMLAHLISPWFTGFPRGVFVASRNTVTGMKIHVDPLFGRLAKNNQKGFWKSLTYISG